MNNANQPTPGIAALGTTILPPAFSILDLAVSLKRCAFTVIAFLSSPWLGVAAFVMYYLIQQIESYFLIPLVMQRAIGLNPIIVIVAVIAGGQLGGITVALLALPAMIVIVILVKKFVLKECNN